MEIIKYSSPIKDNLPLQLIERIFGIDERMLETPQLDGSEIEYNDDIVYLAKDGDTVLGMVHATIPKSLPHLAGLSGVCTTPEARGKGIGKMLFGKIIEEIDALGVKVALLGTGNPIAAKMYSSFGFNYLPCSGVMIRLKEGGVIDFTRQMYDKPIGKITIDDGTAEMRIPIIPLALQNSDSIILDRNINLCITYFFAQRCCMSLYPRYIKLANDGGRYFGVYDERRVLGGIASIIADSDGEYRLDFFVQKSYESIIPALLDKAREISPEFYVEIAEGDSAKRAILEDIAFKTKKSTYHYGDAYVPTVKYYLK